MRLCTKSLLSKTILLLLLLTCMMLTGCSGGTNSPISTGDTPKDGQYTAYLCVPENPAAQEIKAIIALTPPQNYKSVPNCPIYSASDLSSPIAVTDSSGMFSLDTQELAQKSKDPSGEIIIVASPPPDRSISFAPVSERIFASQEKDNGEIKKLILHPNARNIIIGESVQLYAKAVMSDGNCRIISPDQVSWQTDNEQIATVTSNGIATGIGEGKAEVTISYGNLSCTGKIFVHKKSAEDQSFSITGIITGPDGKPVKGAVVTISGTSFTAITNKQGKFNISGLPANQEYIILIYIGGQLYYSETVYPAGPKTDLNISTTSDPIATGAVQGCVTSGSIPADGVLVSAGDFSAVTDSKGKYSIINMPPGQYKFMFVKGGYLTTEKTGEVKAGTIITLDASLEKEPQITTGTISGRAVDDNGKAIAGASIHYASGSSSSSAGSTTAGADGSFTFQNVEQGSYIITAEKDGLKSGSANVSVSAKETSQVQVVMHSLVSIQIDPVNISIAKGLSQQLSATGIFSDGSSEDITGAVSWSSSDETIACISNDTGTKGKVRGLSAGTATITATEPKSGISGSRAVNVTSALLVSIQVNPADASSPKGQTRQFTATGTFTDNSTKDITSSVTWSSSNSSIAQISNEEGSRGFALANGAGSANITASQGVITSPPVTFAVTNEILVSVKIDPPSAALAKGSKMQFTATGIFSDGSSHDITSSVIWASDNMFISGVDNSGLAAALNEGTATITATDEASGIHDSLTVTVTQAVLRMITVEPVNPTIAKGLTKQFKANGVYSDNSTKDITKEVTWLAGDPSVAQISNTEQTKGLASSIAVGDCNITATLSNITSSASLLKVTSAELVSVQIVSDGSAIDGLAEQIMVTGIYTDGTSQDLSAGITWFSSNDSIASVSNDPETKGLITPHKPGTVTIQAIHPSTGTTGSIQFTVTQAALSSIRIEPSSPSVAKGYTKQLTATGIFTDGTAQDLTSMVTWTSSADNIASVSNSSESCGLVSTLGKGNATITAIDPGTGKIASTVMTVTDAVCVSLRVDPQSASVAKGLAKQFTATATYSDGAVRGITENVTWMSSDNSIASVSNSMGSKGYATAAGRGDAVIMATEPLSGLTATANLSVTDAQLVSISINPAETSIAKGYNLQFTATGLYTDNSTQDITTEVTWYSSDTQLMTISNYEASKGLANAAGVGSVNITASLGTVSSSPAKVTVTRELMWLYETGSWLYSSPAVGTDGVIYVGSWDNKLYAINPDGTTKWTYLTGNMIYSSPAIGADGTIYIGSLDGRLYAINPNGTTKWSYQATREIYSSPAIGADGSIYFGTLDGKIYALSASGDIKWTFQTENMIYSSPAIGSDGTIYTGSMDGKLYALSSSGTLLWSYTTGRQIYSSPAIGQDGAIFVGSLDGKVYAINPDGTLRWSYTIGREIYSSPSISPEGVIYIGSNDMKLYAINPGGTLKWAYTTGREIYSTPAVAANGTIFVGSSDYRLHALNSDGTSLWSYLTGREVVSSPAIGNNGTIYVGSYDAKFYAFQGYSELAAGPWSMFRRNLTHTGRK